MAQTVDSSIIHMMWRLTVMGMCIYVADKGNHRIQVFTKDNQYLRHWFVKEDGELSEPFGIAMDTGDTLYVADYVNRQISLFTKEGEFLKSFKPLNSQPCGIELDKNGLIYVTYGEARCIKVFEF